MVKQLTGTSSPLLMFALAAPLTFILAYASFRLVEMPAMQRRRAVAAAIRARLDGVLGRAPSARLSAGRAAAVAFVLAVALILASTNQWWYFLPSVTIMTAAALAGWLLTLAWFAARRPATPSYM
jgi:hypothetical protein